MIHDALVEFSYLDFGKLIVENRRQRRDVKDRDMALYEEFVKNGTMCLEMMINQNIQTVLEACEISPQLYEESNVYWSEINPQFQLISLLVIDKMKLMIPSSFEKEITADDVLKIMDFQIDNYSKIKINQTGNPQITAMVKQSYLHDMVFEQFKMEEEDYSKAKGLEGNQVFAQKAQQLQYMVQMDVYGPQMGMMGGF